MPNALKKSTAPKRERIAPGMRKAVLTRDNHRCTKCGHGPWLLTVDHVKPVSHGGTGLISNLVTLCSTCNSSRGNRAERTSDGGYVR